MNRTIAIAAGGTGGHFFPAEALAAELQQRGHKVVLFTDARSSGETSAAFAQCARYVLPGAGIAGRGAMKALKAVLSLAYGTLKAHAILRRVRPDALVAFGGYPSVPPVLASRLISPRPKVVLHEQNAVLGRANRALSRFASTIALSFSNTSAIPAGVATVLTGNPVRPAIAALAGRGYFSAQERFRLLVLGGSQGARVFSTLIPEMVSRLPVSVSARMDITQQCRAEDLPQVRQLYAELGLSAELSPFFSDIADRLNTAHLVIARAGASTIAELAALGRPSLLVPLPSAIDDHQRANAAALAEAGGAWMMHQSTLFPADLAEFLIPLLGRPQELAPLAAAAAAFGRLDAAARLADLVEHTIQPKDAA
ncbi:MAG: undecaprenyldiphospho-muramoylpentapeptide beta-N-acetylglucosaminyltransferase [Acetobacteraceae bacterium]|nr:undecaprenyldiphospho-muramoylpentapeptide beta-N-acetylglucosaminyltransferase [Acetobacteraceae bacterium]